MIITMKISPEKILCLLSVFCFCTSVLSSTEGEDVWASSLVVKKDQRRTILDSEVGQISAVEIAEGTRNGSFHLQFFKLEPHALFLPVMLHTEMLLYCHSGSGSLSWIDHGKKSATVSLSRGDVYRLRQGSVFFIKSNLETTQRSRLRITALFANSNEDLHGPVSSIGPYSSIADLVRGFDSNVLQAAFLVPPEVIETIKSAREQPLIIRDMSSQRGEEQEGGDEGWEGRFMKAFLKINAGELENKKKKKKQKEGRAVNVLRAERDFENCNGWSLTVTNKDLSVLEDSNFGAFYVNLTKGAMMAPHWNPMATEIAFVVEGQGMVRVVCSSATAKHPECENQSFMVEEGDVFVVPRFHPMSQTSFNNDTLVFMGFSTSRSRNYPQYLVGKASVFQVIDKSVLAAAFNVDNETIVQLVGQQEEALIVECTSCAEEQFSVWQEEVERRREKEERRKREEEEARRREEEEEQRRKEEEEAKRKEEEAAKERERQQQEEDERRQKEEQAQREEEERQKEEEARRQEEEERAEQERRQREKEERRQEEERRQQEEEERERQRQEEEEGRGGGGGGGGGPEEEETEEEAARREQEERERREPDRHGRRGGRGAEGRHRGEEEPATGPEHTRRTRQHAEREKQQQDEPRRGGGPGESEGEAAMRQEEERIRRQREGMRRGGGSEVPPVVVVENLSKVLNLLA